MIRELCWRQHIDAIQFSAETKKSQQQGRQANNTYVVGRTIYACNRHNRTEYQYGTLHPRAPSTNTTHIANAYNNKIFSSIAASIMFSRRVEYSSPCVRVRARGLNSMQSVRCMQIALTHPVHVARDSRTKHKHV